MSIFSKFSNDIEEVKQASIMSNLDNYIINNASKNELSQIKRTLEGHSQDFNIFEATDSKDYTVLHLAAINGRYDMLCYFIEYAKEKLKNSSSLEKEIIIKNWVNKKSNEGYIALHLAAFKGCIKSLEKLVECGSKIDEINEQGLNCIHVAAQGDQPISLVFFKTKGVDIFLKDNKGSNALHWAAFIGSENAMNFLLKWMCNVINDKDGEGGLTPLHLAVISANTRMVRKLLLKGANRNIQDGQNKIPADLANENGYKNILGILESKEGIMEACNIKPSFKPMRKKKRSVLLFFFFFSVLNLFIILFCLPYINHESEIICLILYVFLNFLSLIFFILTWLKNPGYYSLKNRESLINLLKANDCGSICSECEILKPIRSKHCEICNRCVSVYDHHCPWINNCVGSKNHGFFFCFILFTWFTIIYNLLLVITHLYHNDYDLYYLEINNTGLKIFFNVISIGFLVFFFIPLSMLVYVQSINFFLNKTTAERYGFQANLREQNNSSTISNDTNPSVLEIGENRRSRRLRNKKMSLSQYFKNCYLMGFGNARENNRNSQNEENRLLI